MSTDRAMRRVWTAAWLAAAAGATLGGHACAQAPATPHPTASGAAARMKPEELLAREITRIALIDLRADSHPSIEDARVGEAMLTLAHELVPQDPGMLRRAIEAAYGADDQAMVLGLSRELLHIDSEKGDTVAQLRLITSTITSMNQNAEDRLKAYENYLSGPKAELFDKSIRSRLALDAAMLMRERGDSKGFVQKLTQAVQLDSTHKEAAALGAAYYAERMPDDRVHQLEWLVILLMADPMDPNVHMAMARELAAAGAYEQARRFHTNAFNISEAAGGADDTMAMQRRVFQWYVDGPGPVATTINRQLVVDKDAAAREMRRLIDSKMPIENATKPEDVRLSLPVATVAIMAGVASGDPTGATSVLTDAAKTSDDVQARTLEAVREGTLTVDEAAARNEQMTLQLQFTRLWSGLQLDEARAAMEKLRPVAEKIGDPYVLLSAWLRLRDGDAKGAAEDFRAITDSGTTAGLGLAAALEQLGDKAGAVAEYRGLLRDHALELGGAWARSRLAALGDSEDPAAKAAFVKIASGVPAWIDQMVIAPRKFVELTATIEQRSPDALEPSPMQITIGNSSSVPLAFGSDRTISSRLLLSPKLEAGTLSTTLDKPEVVDVNQRLRLMPRERLTVTVWPDPGQSGWLMEAMATRNFRARWRVIQGFRFESAGGFAPGPMGLVAETEAVVKRPLPEVSLGPAEIASRVAGAAADQLPRLAAVVRALLLEPDLSIPQRAEPIAELLPALAPAPKPENPEETLKPVIDAFVTRYPTLDPLQRATLVAILPHAQLTPVTSPFDAACRADGDPLVQAVVLVTRVTAPDDELLTRAAQSADARVRGLGVDLTERLKGTDKVYARLTPPDLKRRPAAGPAK